MVEIIELEYWYCGDKKANKPNDEHYYHSLTKVSF